MFKTKPLLQLQLQLHHFSNSHQHATTPTFLSSLPPSASLLQIKQIHAHVVVSGLAGHGRSIPYLLSLLSLSSDTVPLSYSLSIFHSLPSPTIFDFNNLIRCYARTNPSLSLSLYSSMIRRRFTNPNQHTFTFLLHACSKTNTITTHGVQVHTHVIKFGFARDVFVRNALIHMYFECSTPQSSKRVFEEDTMCSDIVTWNSMLAGLVRNGEVRVAEKVFDEMPQRDVISWSTMIMGYVQNGLLEDGLECFRVMRERKIRPNKAIFVTVLSASAQFGLLGCGRFVHSTIESFNFPITVPIGTASDDKRRKEKRRKKNGVAAMWI